jgi:hypothetical protein
MNLDASSCTCTRSVTCFLSSKLYSVGDAEILTFCVFAFQHVKEERFDEPDPLTFYVLRMYVIHLVWCSGVGTRPGLVCPCVLLTSASESGATWKAVPGHGVCVTIVVSVLVFFGPRNILLVDAPNLEL